MVLRNKRACPPFGWTLKAFSPSKKRREKENKKNTRSVLDTNPEAAPGPKGDLDLLPGQGVCSSILVARLRMKTPSDIEGTSKGLPCN